MYTVENLLEYASSLEKFDPREQDYESRRWKDKALAAAIWMEENGVDQTVAVGEFNLLGKLHRGQKIKIKKGAKLKSMNPKYQDGKIAGRDYVVQIHDFHEGFINPYTQENQVRNPEVVWAGEHGYWTFASLNDIEVVMDN